MTRFLKHSRFTLTGPRFNMALRHASMTEDVRDYPTLVDVSASDIVAARESGEIAYATARVLGGGKESWVCFDARGKELYMFRSPHRQRLVEMIHEERVAKRKPKPTD